MDLFDVARSCARRWYIFVLLLIGVTFFSYNTYSNVQPVYYGSTTLGLAPPSITAAPVGNEIRTNALLNSGGVTLLSNLLAMGMSDWGVHQQVAAQGGSPDFTASVFSVPGGQLPLVVIEISSPDPALATRTLQLAAAQGEGVIRNVQLGAGVPEDQALRTYPVGAPSAPVAGMPSRTRSTVSIFIAGLGLAIIATVLVDVVLARRRQRKLDDARGYTAPNDDQDPERRNGERGSAGRDSDAVLTRE